MDVVALVVPVLWAVVVVVVPHLEVEVAPVVVELAVVDVTVELWLDVVHGVVVGTELLVVPVTLEEVQAVVVEL